PDVMRFLGGVTDQNLDDTRKRIDRQLAHHDKYGFGLWALIEKATGQFVGLAGLKHLEDGPEIEGGYHLARAFWRRGYATEAARACLRYGFEQLHLEKIVAVVQPANVASQRVLEKSGLSYTGMGYYYKAEVRIYAVTQQTL